ncbi:GPW/gp25 family protein [Massilia sp. YIM B02763]|uniref:GPW/gp25 family protein n=1 Tax=Massilia sp. YIM B02763 TaxID=3050130 RepID=UPI0025B6CC2E|nr:GPW/gp25 family protein [Massilia sp. YIM B02763]MDN4056339.1 GPW/gp25 family protein [Massilia sp. YIM B02763]
MRGMDHTTGRTIAGVAHLCQSIARILTTPRGSRIARREFGSDLQDLVDAPLNPATRLRLFAATATALMRWEPRLKLTRVDLRVDATQPGRAVIVIEGTTKETNQPVATTVPLNRSTAA